MTTPEGRGGRAGRGDMSAPGMTFTVGPPGTVVGGAGSGPAADVTAATAGGTAGRRQVLRVTTPHGLVRELRVDVSALPDGSGDPGADGGMLAGVRSGPDDPLRTRRAVDVDSREHYVLRWLPEKGVDATSCAAYDNEVQIGLHLARLLEPFGYPRELSRLVGYNESVKAPFLLLAESGRAVGHLTRRMPKPDRFQVSVMRALSLLEAAFVVHRNITPRTVHWVESSAPHVQLVDFRHARLTGELCGPAPSPTWCAPEARLQGAVADPAEDLWSAGLVILHVLDGPRSPGSIGPPDLREVRTEGLDDNLDGVFRAEPSDRPALDVIMSELNAAHDHVPAGAFGDPVANDRGMRAGWQAFEEVSRRKAAGGRIDEHEVDDLDGLGESLS